MRLAANNIEIQIGGERVALNPSLRVALQLEQRHGFAKLLAGIADGNLTVMAAVMLTSARFDLLKAIEGVPLAEFLPTLIAPLSKHVLALAGIDPDQPKQEAKTGERITFREFHERLYRIATGWLGWSPQQTWDATPAEILEAYKGHLDMLRVLNGGAEETIAPNKPDESPLDRAGLSELKSMARAI